MSERKHSEEYFGDQRDFWWNRDFLDLMARRWSLERAHSLLDVGCGVGHWSRLLFGYLAPDATLTGIDREPEWPKQAAERFRRAFPHAADRARFEQGDALNLPYADATFDVVTCQTVLMHLPDPERGLAEMKRVAKPGGLVIAVEPNNLFNMLHWSDLTSTRPAEEVAAIFGFWLTYQRGKEAQGRGDNSLGERLPGMFTRAGFTDVKTYLSDRAVAMTPPYALPEQKVLIDELEEWAEKKLGPFDEREARSGFLAGGGTEEAFARLYPVVLRWLAEDRQALRDGTVASAGGGLQFLVSGRKAA